MSSGGVSGTPAAIVVGLPMAIDPWSTEPIGVSFPSRKASLLR